MVIISADIDPYICLFCIDCHEKENWVEGGLCSVKHAYEVSLDVLKLLVEQKLTALSVKITIIECNFHEINSFFLD